MSKMKSKKLKRKMSVGSEKKKRMSLDLSASGTDSENEVTWEISNVLHISFAVFCAQLFSLWFYWNFVQKAKLGVTILLQRGPLVTAFQDLF